MSKEGKEPAAKGGKFKKIVIIVVAILVVGGASAGGAVYLTGGLSAHAGEAEDPDTPKLVPRDDASAAEIATATAAARRGRVDPHVFKSTYIPIEDGFTSNLRGGGSFVQMGLSLSTFYDERVVANVEAHGTAIRSAVLMTLAEQDPAVLTSTEGKTRLRQQLTAAINETLEAREGFGGIDSVYFTSLVTQ